MEPALDASRDPNAALAAEVIALVDRLRLALDATPPPPGRCPLMNRTRPPAELRGWPANFLPSYETAQAQGPRQKPPSFILEHP